MGYMKDKWIEQMEPKPHEWKRRWIPVEERLPADGERVLGYDGVRVFEAEVFEGQWLWVSNKAYGWIVTHWQPMPPAP